MKTTIPVISVLSAILLAGNVSFAQESSSLSNHATTVVSPRPLKADGIENFYQLTETVYSGSAPEGERAFAELKKLGIKTIVSVDGTKPDVETAKRFGLRYVHLPFGYDGVPAKRAVELVKAAETAAKPIYVHCHHGLHRGPAGAAVICEGTANWTPKQALTWLKLAGTSTNYAGLYKSVAAFHSPSSEDLKKAPDSFPEISEISPLAEVMVEIDGRFDNLKLIKKFEYQTPPQHPALDRAQESSLLNELFKELMRSPEMQNRPKDFLAKLTEAENAVLALHKMLSSTNEISAAEKAKLDQALEKTSNACSACHKEYRN